MSKLSTIVNQDIVDPRKEGYPCFGIYAGDNGASYMNSSVYNSSFQIISPPYTSVNITTATSYAGGMVGDAMYGVSGDEAYSTQTSFSTQASGGVFSASMHQIDQYPMALTYDCSSLGYRTGLSLHQISQSKFSNSVYLINQVLPEGVRPRRFFCMLDNDFYEVHSLAAMVSKTDRVNLSTYRVASANTDGYGSACYNEKTKTLVVTHGTASTATTFNIFKSTTVDLNSCNTLTDFFASCVVTGFTLARTTYHAESRYDRCILVGDNDLIFMSYRVGNNLQADLINPSTQVKTALATVTGTTSYGQQQGAAYDTKFNLTWDGKWAVLYQPYYYYGNGICAYVVSVEDPTRYFTYLYTGSADGCAMTPIGKDSFCFLHGTNTDSDGISINRICMKHTSTTGTEATFIATSNTGGAVTAISNGGAINPALHTTTLSGGGFTTNYPNFMNINWWPINGKRSYEGVVR